MTALGRLMPVVTGRERRKAASSDRLAEQWDSCEANNQSGPFPYSGHFKSVGTEFGEVEEKSVEETGEIAKKLLGPRRRQHQPDFGMASITMGNMGQKPTSRV